MIACPICGAATAVVETRVVGVGARRRRRCKVRGCDGAVTTIEVAVSASRDYVDGDVVPVPRKQIARLKKIVEAIGGPT